MNEGATIAPMPAFRCGRGCGYSRERPNRDVQKYSLRAVTWGAAPRTDPERRSDCRRAAISRLDGRRPGGRRRRLSPAFGGADGSSARLLCEARGAAPAEDLVQETLIAIHSRRATYDPGQPFTAWVYGIARYKLIDEFRRESAAPLCRWMKRGNFSPPMKPKPAPRGAMWKNCWASCRRPSAGWCGHQAGWHIRRGSRGPHRHVGNGRQGQCPPRDQVAG